MALYPPVVASSMPAFDINEGQIRIYFTLSSYNSSSAAAAAHITVRRQSSNVNVLNSDSEIMQKTILQDTLDKALNRYYVIINNEDIKQGFLVDVLYKVQIRLSSIVATDGNINATFISSHYDQFSEWSTVCIIKPINAPNYYINEFIVEGAEAEEQDNNIFYYPFADFTGVYKAEQSSQILKTWRLRLLNQTYTKSDILNIDDYTLADSGIVSTSAYQYTESDDAIVFLCKLPYIFETPDEKYKLFFEIVTKNNFEGSYLYSFSYGGKVQKQPLGNFKSFINEEQGYIKLDFTLTGNSDDEEESTKVKIATQNNNYVLRRSDSKGQFKKWEDLIYFKAKLNDNPNFVYYDFTAESGMLYKYCIQYIDPRGRRYSPLMLQSPVMAQWEHAFLLESNLYGQPDTTKQLKLKFDFQISSYKTNISQSKTDTIGGRYPYIRRNGNMYYRSFPCSGTITGYMDNAELFISKDKVLENQTTAYNAFQGEQYSKFVNKNNYTYERKFREYVEQFLYNIKPKLYKSMQEGNILIKLMDISLTPKQQLGRLIYTFSATAYEIDASTLDNFNQYGIIKIGEYDPNLGDWVSQIYQLDPTDSSSTVTTDQIIQQITSTDGNVFIQNQDIIGTGQNPAANSIAALNDYGVPNESTGKVITQIQFKNLRIEIDSDPYLIINDNGKLRPVQQGQDIGATGSLSPTIQSPLYQMQSTLNNKDIYLGTLFEINGQQVIVAPPNNIYEIKEDDLKQMQTLSIVPAKNTEMTVNYVMKLYQQTAQELVPKIIKNIKLNAQLEGIFTSENDIIQQINILYKQDYELEQGKVQKELTSVKTINVDTDPGTKVYYETVDGSSSTGFAYINETGELLFDMSNSATAKIKVFKIVGKRIPEELVHIISHEEAEYPVTYDYDQNTNKMYYKDDWYTVDSIQNGFYQIQCPIEALIYYYAIGEERYY